MFVYGQEKQAVVVTKNKVLTVHVYMCVCVFIVTLRKTLQAISKAQLAAEPIGK